MDDDNSLLLAHGLILSSKAQLICQRLCKISSDFSLEAINLREELIKCGVISDLDTYDMVVANTQLRSALVQYLGLALQTDPILSKYGKEFGISDYDIYFHCNTGVKAREFFGRLMPDKPFNEVSKILDAIVTKKKSIQSVLYRIRDQVFANMGLPETPDFELIKRERSTSEKKKKQDDENSLRSEEEIKSDVTKRLFTRSRSNRNTGGNSSIQPDDDDSDLAYTADDLTSEAYSDLTSEAYSDLTTKVSTLTPPVVVKKKKSSDHDVEVEVDNKQKRNYRDALDPSDVQQLYETMECDVLDLIQFVKTCVPNLTRVFEPCVGHGAIADILAQHGYDITVRRDKYTLDESIDFLTDELPDKSEYDIIITNTPFQNKKAFLSRLMETEKPFCAIFPLEILTCYRDIDNKGFGFLIPKKAMKFMRDGKVVEPCACIWVLGNFNESTVNTMGVHTFGYL